MKGQDWLADLLSWHEQHGYDISALFEDRPDLFRVLLEKPKLFQSDRIGKGFLIRVRETVARAQKEDAYKSVFRPESDARTAKEEISIGIVDTRSDDDE